MQASRVESVESSRNIDGASIITHVEFRVPQDFDMRALVGPRDHFLKLLEDNFDARITVRGDKIILDGDEIEVQTVNSLISDFMKIIEQGVALSAQQVKHSIDLVKRGDMTPAALREDVILTYKGKAIRPKTAGQKHFIDAIRSNTITFAIGPAGTGKTYLAMAMAINALINREVTRIILTRPVVEAGESLGFLPGTLSEKIDPYVRPLYDALFDMMDVTRANELIAEGVVEVAPLAYMRGRTLNSSFIILDEAQNTTPQQMKMFLTRLGFGSKMIVTGDVTQIDLARTKSGLLTVRKILTGIDDIAFCKLSDKDVVRHSLVQKIVTAYESEAHGSETCESKTR